MTDNPTESLATFLAQSDHETLPPEVQERTIALLIDALACAVVGRGGPETGRMEALADDLMGPGETTVIGSAQSSTLAGAALINSYRITAFNLCDVYRPAHCHLSPVVVAPALAVAEQRRISGQRLLWALAAGFETACRVGWSLDFPAFRAAGWHSPGVIGPFGGAAAVGVIHGLDAPGMRNALGLAGSQSGGTMAQWGSPTIKFHQSRASLSGLLAGSLAARGYRAGENVIAAEVGGILKIFSNGGTPTRLTDRLGEHWEMMNISLKRWPSGSGLQTTVSALFDLIDERDMTPSSIDKVRLVIPTEAYKAHGEMGWDDKFKAMLSARYMTSVIVHDHNCWIDQFDDGRRLDPDVDRFARENVEVIADDTLTPSAARTEIRFRDGSTVTDFREAPKGDPSDPLEISDVVAKFVDATAETVLVDIVEELTDLASVTDVAPLIRRFRV